MNRINSLDPKLAFESTKVSDIYEDIKDLRFKENFPPARDAQDSKAEF